MIFADEGETVYQTQTVYNDRTGLPVRQLTTLDGVLQSPPDGSPAQVLYDNRGRIREEVWWHAGKEHRDPQIGPAVLKYDPDTNVCYVERFMVNGNISRTPTEPALIVRDRTTGQVVEEAIFLHGIEQKAATTPVDPEP